MGFLSKNPGDLKNAKALLFFCVQNHHPKNANRIFQIPKSPSKNAKMQIAFFKRQNHHQKMQKCNLHFCIIMPKKSHFSIGFFSHFYRIFNSHTGEQPLPGLALSTMHQDATKTSHHKRPDSGAGFSLVFVLPLVVSSRSCTVGFRHHFRKALSG